VTGRSSLALYEADACGLDEHLAYGGVFCVEEPNRCPVAVLRINRLWPRSAADLAGNIHRLRVLVKSREVPLHKYPNVIAWMERVENRESYKASV
jgi:glutathione S-transferase